MAMRDLKEQLAEQEVDQDDDFEIEVIDDRPEEDQRDPADLDDLDEDFELSDEEIQALGSRAQKRIKHLTWRMNEERRQREQALRERDELLQHTKRLQNMTQQQVRQYQKALLERQQALVDNSVKEAKAELALAYEEGEPAKIAEAQAKLTQAQMAHGQNQQFAQQWTQQSQQEDQQGQQGQEGQLPSQRPQVSQETQDWISKNPWFNNNIPMTAYATGVHQDLILNQKVQPDTPAYFAALDKAMRERFPEAFSGQTRGQSANSQSTSQQEQTIEVDTNSEAQVAGTIARPRARTPVAPTRGRKGSSKTSGKVQLTRTEVETAKKLGVPLVEYARQKRAMESI